MPRVAARQSKPAVLHQTLEIPTAQSAPEEKTEEARPDFWTYMQKLTPEEWKEHIVYVTRELPKTNMNGIGGGYLVKIVEPFDIEDIKVAYGGYEFSYIMKRKSDIVYHGRFRIEAPPKLDPQRESAGAAENGPNAFAQQFLSMLRDELERSRGANGADKGTTEKAVEMLSKASDKAMEVILKQVPQPGNAPGNTNNALMDKLLTAAIDRLLAPPAAAPPPPDPAKQLETMLSIFTKIDEIRGSGGGGRRDWKAALVDKGLEALPQVLDTFRETRDANVRIASDRARAAEHLRAIQHPSATPARPSVMTPRAALATPGNASEPVVTSNSGLHTVPLNRVDQPGESAEAPAEIVVETIDTNSMAFTNFIKQRIVEMINRGDHGEQIVDFLDGAKPGYSNTLVEYTPEQLTAFFAMDPILRAAIEHPNWPEVLDEARNYILEPDAPEAGEAELEPAPAGARRKPKPN